jgi:sigma-B regulation protein RsbU (phosphoserine phosphatase)
MNSTTTGVKRSPAAAAAFPTLLYNCGAEQREYPLSAGTFSIGRRAGKDLEIADPRVSRDHADIVFEDGSYYVVDAGSKLGTFVNKEKVTRKKLEKNDRIEFGVGTGAEVVFDGGRDQSSMAREFLSHIGNVALQDKQSDLEKLALFLEAARKLNTAGALEEIFISLIDTTLRLTGAERGFVFTRARDGKLKLTAGCTKAGERLHSDATISHSILQDSLSGASDFVITDTTKLSAMAARQSIIAHDLRTVIAIPLRKAHAQTAAAQELGGADVLGALYLDSRFASGNINKVSHDLLGVIAREAAALVESTQLAKVEEASRRYQQEMTIAATIQQRLMNVTIPELPYVSVRAKNLPCRDIGGDFYDLVLNEDGLTAILTDVSGKGISAAILASILQGMIYAQLVAKVPLADVVTAVNSFLCERVLGEKYATLVIARVSPQGELEYVCCGHVPPVLVQGSKSVRLEESNMPVGLIADATFQSARLTLDIGDRVVLVTDGVTEAENATGEFFGDERLEQAASGRNDSCFEQIFSSIRSFCGETAFNDDCTVLELWYGDRKTDHDSTVSA